MNLDIHTLIIVLCLTNLMQTIALFILYQENTAQGGVGRWVLGSALFTLGCIFHYLRDLPAWGNIAIVVNNAFFFAGFALLYSGIRRFFGLRDQRGVLVSFCAAITVFAAYFTYFENDLAARQVIFSLACAVFSLLSARVLLTRSTRVATSSVLFLATVFVGNGLFFLGRMVMTVLGVSPADMFASTWPQVAVYLEMFAASMLWTFGIIILVNRRLKTTLLEAKEHFESIFHTSPDAVLITSLQGGRFVEINKGFTELSGYTCSDVLGKSVLDVSLWRDPADRQKIVAELREKESCENMEMVFQRKDGSLLTGMVSARLINLYDAPHIISVTRDITERKKIETEREQLIGELQDALEHIKTLRGIVPICASCKRIRDDMGYWEQVEAYVSRHTEAQFTHGICPECMEKLYPDHRKKARVEPQ